MIVAPLSKYLKIVSSSAACCLKVLDSMVGAFSCLHKLNTNVLPFFFSFQSFSLSLFPSLSLFSLSFSLFLSLNDRTNVMLHTMFVIQTRAVVLLSRANKKLFTFTLTYFYRLLYEVKLPLTNRTLIKKIERENNNNYLESKTWKTVFFRNMDSQLYHTDWTANQKIKFIL